MSSIHDEIAAAEAAAAAARARLREARKRARAAAAREDKRTRDRVWRWLATASGADPEVRLDDLGLSRSSTVADLRQALVDISAPAPAAPSEAPAEATGDAPDTGAADSITDHTPTESGGWL